MSPPVKISVPLTGETVASLKSGDRILLNGTVYTARDAAHKRFSELIREHNPLPFDIRGQTLYYVGPAPARPGKIIGPAGPTTSARMDPYTPELLALGLKGMLGKGPRNKEVVEAIRKHKAIYLVATGGAAVLLAAHIKKAEVVAYRDLGPEAVYRLTLEDFPATVAIDSHGTNLFETETMRFRR